MTEASVRQLSGFHEDLGIYAELLGDALTQLNAGKPHRGAVVEPDSLPTLLRRTPFLAMLDSHWIIVDGATTAGDLLVRDPAALPTNRALGTEGQIARSTFEAWWNRGIHQAVFRE